MKEMNDVYSGTTLPNDDLSDEWVCEGQNKFDADKKNIIDPWKSFLFAKRSSLSSSTKPYPRSPQLNYRAIKFTL